MNNQTMDELRIKHEELRGRAEVFGKAVDVDPAPPYIGANLPISNAEWKRELKGDIAYYEGFCDAAITVLEMKVREKE